MLVWRPVHDCNWLVDGSPPPPLDIGTQVGPYRIVGELGRGGMGMVYRAAHLLLRRPAAIKVLRPELGRCANARARFLAEARAMAASPRSAHEVVAEVSGWLATQGRTMPQPGGVRRRASMVASGIASSFAALGARYRWFRRYQEWRSGRDAAPRGRIDTVAPTAIVRRLFTAGVADTRLTSAPTQPMAALEPFLPPQPPTLIASPRFRTPPPGAGTPELGGACADGIEPGFRCGLEPIEPFRSR